MLISRRKLITGVGAIAVTACASQPSGSPVDAPVTPSGVASDLAPRTPVSPVLVSEDRVIETYVGLRPRRQGGFRLEAEPFLGKSLIHNYGHGGDGWSLSWGGATVAAEMAFQTGDESIAVLGCGIMGLTTAFILASWGRKVRILADQLPPDTTSNKAGALVLVPDDFERVHTTPEMRAQDRRVRALSHTGFDQYVGKSGYGVKHVSHYFLGAPRSGENAAADNVFLGRRIRRRFTAVMITPGMYLDSMLKDAREAGVTIERRKLNAAAELAEIPEQTIVNCTGLGAGALFLDPAVEPDRGQITLLKPQPEIDYSYIARHPGGSSLYMFPRDDSIVLGGSHDRGDDTLVPYADLKQRMMQGHAEMARWAGAESRLLSAVPTRNPRAS